MIAPKLVNRNTKIKNFNTFDPSSIAFFNSLAADGVTLTATQKNAINRLVLNYKGKGNLNNSIDLWAVSSCIYPYIGNSATAHKYNLKNPQNTNGAHRITFSGGWTHNSNGITGNAVNTFGNTHFKPNDLAQNSNRLFAYVRTDTGGTSFESIGGASNAAFTNGLAFDTRKSTNSHAPYSNTAFTAVSNPNRTGLIGVNRIVSGSFKVFRNGLSLYSVTAASATPFFQNMYVGAQNNSGSFFNPTGQNLAFEVFGDGLSDANSLLEYQIIQQFQTDLGRNI
jgi:hypothetical protein